MFAPMRWIAALAILIVPASLCHGAIGSIAPNTGSFNFQFSGTANGGVGSATMTVTVTSDGTDTTIVAQVYNTSPTTYGDPAQLNLSAIDGFGFDVDPNSSFTWMLEAQEWNGTSFVTKTLGDGAGGVADIWQIDTNAPSGNIQVDLFANNGSGVSEALYNPDLAGNSGIGNTDPFFTEAILTLTFAGSPSVNVLWATTDEGNDDVSPYVRMQRVGNDGSLKLSPGEPPDQGPLPGVPEPASIAAWLLGAGAFGFVLRRRVKKDAA